MNGIQSVKIRDRRSQYKFELKRNITIIRGNSGTGKTTLFDMVSAHARLKEKSGVQIECDKNCLAISSDDDWKRIIKSNNNSIIFIEEANQKRNCCCYRIIKIDQLFI